MMQRQSFTIASDTGSRGDTGPPAHGTIRQVRWQPTTADTGGDLYMALINAVGDTAGGFQIYNDNDCLGAAFTRQPSINQVSVDGLDSGHSLSDAPFVAAGERLRIKTVPGATLAGKLTVYIED